MPYMQHLLFIDRSKLATKEVAMILAVKPLSSPGAVPPSAYTVEGMLATTLLVRSLIDLVQALRK